VFVSPNKFHEMSNNERNLTESMTLNEISKRDIIQENRKELVQNLNGYNALFINFLHTCRSPTFIHPARLSMALSVRRIFDFNQDK
jgi:hypothetical protein